MLYEEQTQNIIGAFFEVYNQLGYGFLESVYAAALEHELVARGHAVAREVRLRVFYKDLAIAHQRIDMMVDEKIIVEAKASDVLAPHAKHQLLNYLKAAKLEVGLLLYFGPKPRVHRITAPATPKEFIRTNPPFPA